MNLSDLVIVVRASTRDFEAGMMKTRAEIAKTQTTAQRMNNIGGAMAGAGRKLTMGLTLPVVAAGAAAVHMAAGFEDAMLLIQTQAGGSAKDVEELSKGILGMKNVQHGPEELANSMYHLKSVGMDNAAALRALTSAEKLASVGQSDLEATTNAVAGAYKSGIKGAQDFDEAAATINATIGAGNLRMDDYVSAMGTGVLVNAQQAGVSLKDVGAALATMTSRNIPAVRAATALKMAFAGMTAPSGTAIKMMDKIGLAPLALAKSLRSGGLPAAIELLKKHLGGLSKTQATQILGKMFGAKSSQAILTLIGNTKDYAKVQKQVDENSTKSKFAEAVAAQAKSAGAVWARLKSDLGKVAVEFGTMLLPAAVAVGKFAKGMVDWLGKLTPAGRKNILIFAGIAAVIGPLLILLGKMAQGVAAIINVTKAFGHAPGAIKGIAGAAKGAVGGLARLAQGFKSSQVAESAFSGRMGSLGGKLRKVFDSIKTGALPKKLGDSFKKWGSAISDSVAKGFAASKDKLKGLLQKGTSAAASGLKVAVSAVAGVAGKAGGVIKDTAATVANTAAKLANAVATKVVAAAQWLWNAALTANPIGLIIVGIVALVAIFIVLWKRCAWFRDFWKGLWKAIAPALSAIWRGIKAAWDKVVEVTRAVWAKIGPTVTKWVKWLWAGLKYDFELGKKIVKAVWDWVYTTTRAVWAKIGPAVVWYVKSLWTGLKFWFKVIAAVLKTAWNVGLAVTRKVWPLIVGIVRVAVGAVKVAVGVIKVVVAIVRAVWNAVAAVSRAVWHVVAAVVRRGIQNVVTAVHIVQKVVGAVRKAWNTVHNITSAIWGGLKKIIGGVITWIWDQIKAVLGKLKGAYDTVKGWLGGDSTAKGGKGVTGRGRFGHAEGAYIPATTGGYEATLGEGGEGEWVVPASKAKSFAQAIGGLKGGGGVSVVVNIANVNGTDRQAADRLARMASDRLMSGVLRQMVGQNA